MQTKNDVIWGQASWAKMTLVGGQANSTGMPPNQTSKQSGVTNLSFYKHFVNVATLFSLSLMFG
jgi:hypothetical protein